MTPADEFKDPLKARSARAERMLLLQQLIAEGLSDLRIAARLGCRRCEVAQVRRGRKLHTRERDRIQSE